MTKEVLELLAPHGDQWCLDLAALPRFLDKDARNSDGRTSRLPRANGTVAIIPVHGVMTKRGFWGYGGTDLIGRTIDAAQRHRDISGIVLDYDTPGGSTYGLMEFADLVHKYRASDKPMVAIANPVAASAGLWSASSAQQFIVTPSGDVGSLGVWTLHMDYSKAMADFGLKATFIFAGKHKVDGNPYEPLSDEVKAEIQKGVDETYDQFVSAMARNRGVTKTEVKAKFGDGKMLSANEAKSVGLVDRVATLEDVLSGMKATGAVDGEHLESLITEHLCNVWTEKPENASVAALNAIRDTLADIKQQNAPKGHGVEALKRRRERERSRA